MITYDTIIVGAGPAGMSAALFAEGDGLSFRLIEKGVSCKFVEEAINTNFTNLENYLGIHSLTGTEVAEKFRDHLKIRQIPVFKEEIIEIERAKNLFNVTSNMGTYLSKSIILSTGTRPKKIDVNGIDKLKDRVYYNVERDISHYADKDVLIVGGRNSGAVTAVRLKEAGARPLIVEKSLITTAKKKYLDRLTELSIPLLVDTCLERIIELGENLEVYATVSKIPRIIKTSAIFGCIGYVPNNDLAIKLGLILDSQGYIEVDRKMQTSVKGVYAAGDVNGGVKMISVASGEGAIAEYYANSFVRSEWKEE